MKCFVSAIQDPNLMSPVSYCEAKVLKTVERFFVSVYVAKPLPPNVNQTLLRSSDLSAACLVSLLTIRHACSWQSGCSLPYTTTGLGFSGLKYSLMYCLMNKLLFRTIEVKTWVRNCCSNVAPGVLLLRECVNHHGGAHTEKD